MWDMFLITTKGHPLPVDSIKKVKGDRFLGVREVPRTEDVLGAYLQHQETRQRKGLQHFQCLVQCRKRDTLKVICEV